MRRWPRRRAPVHRAIRIRIMYHGDLLLELDSDLLHVLAGTKPDGWAILRAAPGRDWPEIIIKPVMMPD